MSESIHNRQHIRHPTDIPIHWSLGEIVHHNTEYLRNISEGGLAFISHTQIPEGATIEINIPVRNPEVSIMGIVVWCRPSESNSFEVGVHFVDAATRFKMRMVEQICHIEHYKKEILETEGRELTGEQAALEWIKRFAKHFPR